MKKIITGFLFTILTLGTFSQKDPDATKILDKFSSTALAAPSVSMKFILTTTDEMEGTNKSVQGSIILNKDKYWLNLEDNIIWYNGETSWNYLPGEKEVTISKPGKKDNSFQSKPSALFSLYKKGYKTRLLSEESEVYLIDLYPEDINSDNIMIRLKIGKSGLDLKNLEYKYKNGVTVTLNVQEYNLKQKTVDSTFVFSPSQYGGIEIIDMR